MVQLYNPPITQLLRSLLLQCVFLLGIVSMAVAQAPVTYDGPWRSPASPNVETEGLVADGADISPSNTGGSAQFRTTSAFVDIKLNGNGLTGYKLSYSLVATTTRAGSAEMRVSYSTDNGQTFGNDVTSAVPAEASRIDLYLPAAATDVKFQLASVSNAYVFLDAVTVSQEPELESFTPAEGVPGTPVTITGTHLNETSAVFFGTVAAESITVNDGTSVSTVVPFGAESAHIKVVTPYGEAVSADEFVVPAPVVSAFAPASGGAGDEVTISGQYFTGVTSVEFNGIAATPKAVTDNEITVDVPVDATDGVITVISPAGRGASIAEFDVLTPSITEFTMVEGADGSVGTAVTISGTYLTAVDKVLFNGAEAVFTIVDNTTITTTVPLGASTGYITVQSAAGDGVSPEVFNVPAPQFVAYDDVDSQFKPTSAGPNMQITLYGVNLASVSSVVFLGTDGDDNDNREATIAAPTKDTELVVTVPADAKTGKIQLIAPGKKTATSEQTFNFVPAPVISSVANTTATDERTYGLVGEQITITGQNFGTAYEVTLGSTKITRPDAETNTAGFGVNGEGTAITFDIPDGAASGSVTVKTQGGVVTWDGPFDVIYAPTIASFSPTKGPIGQEVTIKGEHLKYVSEVVFLGSSESEDDHQTIALATPNASDTEIKVTVPTGAVTGLISVTNPVNTATSTEPFEVVRTPVILSFTPAQGIAGTVVSIEGYNFSKEGELTAVTFAGVNGSVNAAAYKATSDTTLTATVPTGAITGRITVSNANGSGESPSDFIITQKPTITSIAPFKGTRGSTVVIEGTEFVGDNIVVTFLGTDANGDEATVQITGNSSTQITATVPANAVTGKLMVTNVAGDSEPSADTYTVVTTPEIISFTPTEGKAGDAVTIKGWLLESVTAVGFNGNVQAVPSPYKAADSTFTVAVPTNATTGTLTLIVGEDVVFTSADVFTVIPAPTIVSFTPTQGVAGTPVTIRGTNFEGLSEVVFNEAKVEDLTGVTISTVEEGGVTYQEFTVAVPDSATSGFISLKTNGGTATSATEFTVPVPANIAFTPTTSYANQQVVITGDYFKNLVLVTFNGEEAEVVSKDEEAGTITVKAPFDAGSGPVVVTTLAGEGTSADNYTVIEPIIDNLSAEDGTAKGYADRTLLTITGRNFSAYYNEATGAVEHKAPEVVFNGARVIAETYTNETIEVLVPTNARSGNVTVISGSGESEPKYFEVMAPIISAVNPAAVYAGQYVTVTGSNFIDVLSVNYGGIQIPVSEYSVESETEIIFRAPVMTANSTSTLSITSKSGTGTSTLLTVYKPVIISVSRNRVYAGVSTLKITGNRFDEYYHTISNSVRRAVSKIDFAGAAGARVDATIKSATYSSTEEGTDEVEVTVPSTATTGKIRVTSESGTGEWSQDITIIGAPTITKFSANSGLVGSQLTITGTNLDEATRVTFLGTDAAGDEVSITTGYTVKADGTEITFNVPANAITGKISVTTPYGGGEGTTVTSTGIFRVVYAPTITGFTPVSGPSGATVRITGANLWDLFSTGTTPAGALEVYFNRHDGFDIPSVGVIDKRAAVTAYDEVGGTWVDVTVPEDAITGNIKVVNKAGNATSESTFEVTSPVLVRFEHENGTVISSDSPARKKERILLRGYNLEGIGTIRIGTVYATSFFEPEDKTRVEVVVPLTATSNTVTITAAGGSDVSSEQLYIAVPTIKVDPGSLSFNVEAGQISEAKSYTVSATNLAVGENLAIRITGTNDFYMAVSQDAADDVWSKGVAALTPDAAGNIPVTTFWVRSQPGIDASTNQSGVIAHTSNGAATVNLGLSTTVLPLPVELMSFNAALQNNNVLLTWATASEQNNSHFEVEMSRNPKNGFEKVGRVDSKGSNSMTRLDYEFTHRLGNLTGTIYYRLKQVDIDGTTDYSKVVAVNVKAREVLQQVLVAPNPINYNSKLYVSAEVSGKANLVVYSMTGKKVYAKVVELQEGPNEVQLPVYEKLNKGMYILSVELNGQVSQVKLVKE